MRLRLSLSLFLAVSTGMAAVRKVCGVFAMAVFLLLLSLLMVVGDIRSQFLGFLVLLIGRGFLSSSVMLGFGV
jgi:hypothetical protein